MIYVFDTNAVIKMLYGKHMSHVMKAFYHRKITLAYHSKMLEEYVEVAERLSRMLPEDRMTAFFILLEEYGWEIIELGASPELPDPDDEIFIQVINSPELTGHQPMLVTDNQRDYVGVKSLKMCTFQELVGSILSGALKKMSNGA